MYDQSLLERIVSDAGINFGPCLFELMLTVLTAMVMSVHVCCLHFMGLFSQNYDVIQSKKCFKYKHPGLHVWVV